MSQAWFESVKKQLKNPSHIEGDTLLDSTAPISCLKDAIEIGANDCQKDAILMAGSKVVDGGDQGFCAASAMLTAGASPKVYNEVYKSFRGLPNRQAMTLAAALRMGRLLVHAPNSLTDKAKIGYYLGYGMQGAPENTKMGLAQFLCGDLEYASGIKTAIAEIAKARGYKTCFGIDLNPIDAVENIVSSAEDIVSSIPGVGPVAQWFGGQVQDFANTSVGQIALTAFAGVSYEALAPALGVLGPQLASVTFALPGVAKGDTFTKAWITAYLQRLKELVEYLGGQAAAEAAAEFEPAIDGLVQSAQQAGIDPEAFASKLQIPNFTKDQLNQLAGTMGVRTDMLQEGLDYLSNKTGFGSLEQQMETPFGQTIDMPAVPGRFFDPQTGSATSDTRAAAIIDNPQNKIIGVMSAKFTTLTPITRLKAAPELAQAKGAASGFAASSALKNYVPVATPMPAKKIHWYNRLEGWFIMQKKAHFGSDFSVNASAGLNVDVPPPPSIDVNASASASAGFSDGAPDDGESWFEKIGLAQPSPAPQKPSIVASPVKAGITQVKNLSAIRLTKKPNLKAVIGPGFAPSQPADGSFAPSTPPVAPMKKLHWWTRAWNFVKVHTVHKNAVG